MFKKIDKNDYDLKVIRNFKNKYIANCDGKATRKLVDFLIKLSSK